MDRWIYGYSDIYVYEVEYIALEGAILIMYTM